MSLLDHTVTSVETFEITTRYPRTIGRNARLGSHGDGPTSNAVIIRTDTGRVGWGLAGGRAADPATVVGRPVGELIDPATGVPDEHRWLDFALHDLAGVILDLPVYELLGAAGSRSVPCYDGGIYFADLDPDDAPRGIEAVLADCAADTGLGFTDFKLKIGRGNRWQDRAAGDRRDIEVTRAVREAYPNGRILVDANDGYDLDGFLTYLDAVADCNLYWVEEPFLDNAADLAALRAHLDRVSPETLIADGESNPEVDDLLKIAADGGLDILLMDVVSYGLTPWRRLMPAVAATGTQASPHAWGLPLKSLYAAQFAAGLGNIPIVEGVPGHTADVDTSPYSIKDGVITVPDRPGFGLPVPDRTN
ncbi:enolase C-terminal domain-like protein [Microlunatus sp. GCM10028923]|uniref:enolase C-terminal domain-like protein n=1 Tax=Microlunatus sp. GCM10028923 TaxID=3273400 RepID=UPI0036170EEB